MVSTAVPLSCEPAGAAVVVAATEAFVPTALPGFEPDPPHPAAVSTPASTSAIVACRIVTGRAYYPPEGGARRTLRCQPAVICCSPGRAAAPPPAVGPYRVARREIGDRKVLRGPSLSGPGSGARSTRRPA